MFDFLKRKKKNKQKPKPVSKRTVLMKQLSKAGNRYIFRREDAYEVWSKIIKTRNISETARQFDVSYCTIRNFMRRYPCPEELIPQDLD